MNYLSWLSSAAINNSEMRLTDLAFIAGGSTVRSAVTQLLIYVQIRGVKLRILNSLMLCHFFFNYSGVCAHAQACVCAYMCVVG